jgi:hypothetical protein
MVDLIRLGKAPEVVRRKGAEGGLPVPAEEKIEILTLLSGAADPQIRSKALETLKGWNHLEVRQVMASPLTAPDVLAFAAENLVAVRGELREILLWNPSLPEDKRRQLQPPPAPPPPPAPAPEPAADEVPAEVLAHLDAAMKLEDPTAALEKLPIKVEAPPEATKSDAELTQKDRETLIEKIMRMGAVDKIKAALTGNLETRMLLIRDSNKVVARAVLQSPKLAPTEIEGYAAAKNVSEEVLRLIAANRKFMKTYIVMRALINNPRAPIDITMPLLQRLNERDLKGVALNRNVPEVIRGMATKIMKQKEEATKPKLPGKH